MKLNDPINASVTSLLGSLDMCAREAFCFLWVPHMAHMPCMSCMPYVPYHSMEI